MPKGRCKIKKVGGKKSKEIMDMMKDGQLSNMFNQMLGVEAADPNIVSPKYKKCRIAISALSSYMSKFADNKMMRETFPAEIKNLEKINNFSKKIMGTIEGTLLSEPIPDKNISTIYMDFKKNDIIRTIFVVHSQIKIHKKHIEDQTNLTDTFITDAIGYELFPFKKICKLNLYIMWSKDPPKNAKVFILKFLHQVYKLTKLICDTILSADVDINNFSDILVKCITELKKVIPNCNDAFNRIENAVDLLEGNFDGYYKDFIKTENPSIIFLNFIGDVSNEQKRTSITLISQFRKIISYFQKTIKGQMNNPQMKAMFNVLNTNLTTLEKSTDVESEEKSDSDSCSDSDSDNVPEGSGPPPMPL